MNAARRVVLAVVSATLVVLPAGSAGADHTHPRVPQASTVGLPPLDIITRGQGTWDFIANFPANPGTDLKLFTVKGKDVYASSGTLGQADAEHVGQRIIRLIRGGVVAPEWIADHGSAHCTTNNTSVTGLQHDAAVTGTNNPQLLVDSTDAVGRCHDTPGGGLELVDISRISDPTFEPRELHLTRHAGTSHTVTVDDKRPHVVYNSSSDFTGRPWIDVLDVRSCMLPDSATLQQKRDACRPAVYRIPFGDDWSRALDVHTNTLNSNQPACHDITSRGTRLYCAGLDATLIFDVAGMFDAAGNIKGTPLPCTVVPGTRTTAMITDCTAAGPGSPSATGWTFLGSFHHPGRDCVEPHAEGSPTTNCNSNMFVRSDEGVSVSHEADPDGTGNYMFVTDERGGGVVPPGASCQPGLDNPISNGGAHVFDIRDPANIQYALQPDGSKAVYISDPVVPAATFCDIHVMEPLKGERRFVAAYYSQGTKIVDYQIDKNGRWTFTEVASFTPRGVDANTWVAQVFKTVKSRDTVTYYFMASDIQRGIDVFSWTGPKGPVEGGDDGGGGIIPIGNAGLGAGLVLLPLALGYRRRRDRRG